MNLRHLARRMAAVVVALVAVRVTAPWLMGADARGWLDGDGALVHALCAEQVRFEALDTAQRETPSTDRFVGEWALVTHQMTALGLAQAVLEHPEWKAELGPPLRLAAVRSFLPEMRDFGTRAWGGEDALASLSGPHGHAYLAYPALAVSVARWVDPTDFPPEVARAHDAVIAAFERRLLASPTALIETYPDEAFPTDVAAVAAAIAVHGRATGVDHSAVLSHWGQQLRATQVDPSSGFVHQRMSVGGTPRDVPRGSGTGLAAYYAGFVDRDTAWALAQALLSHQRSWSGFGGVLEFDRQEGTADIDSGPVLLGVSVAATGFSLAPFRAFHQREAFTRLYRTTALFGLPRRTGERLSFRSGGAFGNALLLAMLTSGPELAR